MIIGIKQTPQKGALPKIEVFYCGHDGAALRAAHAKLLVKNEESKFFSITNPFLIPLQNAVPSTEEHPDELAARAHRKSLADKTTANSTQAEIKN